jgi:carbohydrate-selective porin OprB
MLAGTGFPQEAQSSPTREAAKQGRWSELYPEFAQRLDSLGFGWHGGVDYDWSEEFPRDQDADAGFGRYSLDLSLGVDGRKALGVEGSAAYIRLKHHMNHFGGSDEGAAQVYSNIDAPSRTTLYEVWLEQRLFSNRLRIKAGKIDANSEFATVANAGDFLNSSMGFSPTIVAFPSYPAPKPGVNFFLRPNSTYGLGLGVFQTDSGTMSVIEPGMHWFLGSGERAGRASLGYWRVDGTLSRFDRGTADGAQGFYGVLEQSGWRHPWQGKEGERELSTFLQAGSAENQISAITRHLGGGVVVSHPLHGRQQDSIGVAATWVHFSSAPQAGFSWTGEVVTEMYYKATLSKHLAIVQDFQFLHHPGGRREQSDGAVITPRLLFTF